MECLRESRGSSRIRQFNAVSVLDQVAYVSTDTKSKSFSLTRGVKQGDPISALLFIAVMQSCFDDLQRRWDKANSRRKGLKFGIPIISSHRTLTNLRFADDVILFAQQCSDIAKMLRDLSTHAGNFGLRINFSKTKVMTWNALVGKTLSIDVDGNLVG